MIGKIREIKVKGLLDFVESKEFKALDNYPISRLRAISQFHNPRSEDNDIALFLYYDNDKLAGYLGGVSDLVSQTNDEIIKVYWISCMWIIPEYRRKGVALELMNYAYDAYHGKVLITNYIPQSKAVFEKTGNYTLLDELPGIRGFLRFDFQTIITRKFKALSAFKFLFRGIDSLLNAFVNLRLQSKVKGQTPICTYAEINEVDSDLEEFLQKEIGNSPIRRGKDIFDWVKKYPWVVNEGISADEKNKYYFSQYLDDYKQWYFKITHIGKVVGFIVMSRIKGELKTHYLIYVDSYVDDVVVFLTKFLVSNKVKTLVCHDLKIANKLKDQNIFIHTKTSTKGFLVSTQLKVKLNYSDFKLFEGDGDSVFT